MYLFGAFSPITGDNFRLYLPYCKAETFQLFLDLFSLERGKVLKVVFLDNGAPHVWGKKTNYSRKYHLDRSSILQSRVKPCQKSLVGIKKRNESLCF